MFAAIDDVHHRHRQDARRGAADIAEQRLGGEIRGGLGGGKRHAEDGVGAKAGLVVGAVQFDHRLVDADLFGGVKAHQIASAISPFTAATASSTPLPM